MSFMSKTDSATMIDLATAALNGSADAAVVLADALEELGGHYWTASSLRDGTSWSRMYASENVIRWFSRPADAE